MNSQNSIDYEDFTLVDVDSSYKKIQHFLEYNAVFVLNHTSIQKVAQNGQWIQCLSDLEKELKALLSDRVINLQYLPQYLNQRLQPFIIFILNKIIYDQRRLKLQCYLNEILFLVQKLAFKIWKQYPIQVLSLFKEIHNLQTIEFYNSRITELQVYNQCITQFYNERILYNLSNEVEINIDQQQMQSFYPLINEVLDQLYLELNVYNFSPFQRMQIHYFYKNGGFDLLNDSFNHFTLKHLDYLHIQQYFKKYIDKHVYMKYFQHLNFWSLAYKLSDDDIKNSTEKYLNQFILFTPTLISNQNMSQDKQTQQILFQMRIYLLCLRCSSIQKRIYGLQQLGNIIIINNNLTSTQNFKNNNQVVLNFLVENQVFQDLFGEKSHYELINHSFPIVKFLYLNKSIKGEDLVTIFKLARGKHETWMHTEILNIEDVQIMLQNIKSNPIGLDGLNFIKSLGRNEYLSNGFVNNAKDCVVIDSKYKKQKLNTQDDYKVIQFGDCTNQENKSCEENILSQQKSKQQLQIKNQIVEYLFIVVHEQCNNLIGKTAFDIAIELICYHFQCLRIQYLIIAIEALNSNQTQLSIYHYFIMIQQIIQSSYPISKFQNSIQLLIWMQQTFDVKFNYLKLIQREKLKSLKKVENEYLQVITQCVNFYEFLNQNSKIKQYELQLLWKLLQENARCLEEKDLFFNWSFRQTNLEQDAIEWLLFEIIKQQQKSQSMLRCLIKLFLHFNVKLKVMKKNNDDEYELLDQNMIGIDVLWRIFHSQPELYNQLSDFFIKLLKMQSNSNILNNLKQYYLNELFSQIQNPTSIQLVIQLLEAFEGFMLMDQEEKILINILNNCSNALNPKKQEILISSNLQVYHAKQIIGQKLNPQMKPEGFDIFCKGTIFKDHKTLKDYKVNSKLTFILSNRDYNETHQKLDQDVNEKIKKIQDIVNIYNKQYILSILKDRNWDVDHAVEDLLEKGDQLYIEYQQKNINLVTLNKIENNSSFAFLISNQYIEQLFKQLNQENQELNEKIWSILQMIPSNQQVYQLIESSQNDWSKLFIVDNKYRLQYHLQILKEQLSCDYAEEQDYYKNLRHNFLSKGGLQLLLNNLDQPKEILLIILDIFQMYLNSYAINQIIDNDYICLLKLKQTNQIASLFLVQNLLQDNEIQALQTQNQLFVYDKIDIQINWDNLLQNLFQRIDIEQCYTTILCVLYIKPNLLSQQIPINKLFQLLTNKSSEQRKLSAIFILTLNSIAQKFGYDLSKQLLIEFIKRETEQLELFIVIGELIEQANDISFLKTQDLVLQILNFIKSRQIIESPFRENEDKLLQGNLLLLKSLLKRDSTLSENLIDDEFSQYIYECLFEMQNNYSIYPIYKRNNTRKRAFDLLLELSKIKKHLFRILYLIQKNQSMAYISSDQYCEFGIKGSHGYVGLYNEGATCYINSLLQQLFMNIQFRKGILNGQILIRDDDDKLIPLVIQNPCLLSQEQIKDLNDHTLFQLQFVFIQLQESVKQYINPIQFIKTLQGFDGQYINPIIQGDCNEFFNLLILKLESDLKPTLQSNLINQSFGGTLVNEIKSQEINCDFQKETEEPFLTVSVEIKNKQNLFEALDFFVKSDVLDGENQYFCDEVQRKIDVEKRCYFLKLPKTFIFHLKRFEFDINTNTRSKINDYCEFPLEINMFKWTRDNIVEHKQLDNFQEYQYMLKGVLVHTGCAEGGHYFSYIKDNQNLWFEFNDKLILPFDILNLNEQCFGGNSNKDNQWGMQNSKNAYMLFYEKVIQSEHETQVEIEDLGEEEQKRDLDIENNNEIYLRNEVIRQNTLYLMNKLLNDQEYINFLQRLLQFGIENIESYYQFELLKLFTVFTFKLFLQNKNQQIFQNNIRILNNSYYKNSQACLQLVEYWTQNKQILIELLVESQTIESAQVLNLVIEQARKMNVSSVDKFFVCYLSELLPIIRYNVKKGVYYFDVISHNLDSDEGLLKQIQQNGYFNKFYSILKEKIQLLQGSNYLKIVLTNYESLILICEILGKVIQSCITIGMQQCNIQGLCPTYCQKGQLNLNIDQLWIEELFENDDFRRYILSMVQHQKKLVQMIKHICWNDQNISYRVIEQIVVQILDYNNKWQQLEQITDVLIEILNIEDELQEFRIKFIFSYEQDLKSQIRGTTIMQTIQKDDLNYGIGIICMIAQLGTSVFGMSEYLNQNKEDFEFTVYKLKMNLNYQYTIDYPVEKIGIAIKQLQSIFKLEVDINFEEDDNQKQFSKDDNQKQFDRVSQNLSDQAQVDNDETNEISE
ncbi:unnamed protein product [Paramecium sonneborni]|uniref:USP domain-containing protein n=1 Tax=Paramecium sonneborni TaxID=65129 RepID=A0A8S1RD37_9CILI|nr:unnamed protein product [Paramecium sonneborni]